MTDDLLFGGPVLWTRVLGRGEANAPIVRAAGAGTCKRCEAWLILGLDSDMCALDARADAEPVTTFGEACARLLGLRTYELARTRGAWHLEIRDMGAIRSRPAGTGRVDVLAEHRCGADLERAAPRHPDTRPVSANAKPNF